MSSDRFSAESSRRYAEARACITGKTLRLYGAFDSNLAAQIFDYPDSDLLAIRTLDVTDVHEFFADGALPLAALFLKHRRHLRVRYSKGSHIEKVLRIQGWLDLFEHCTVSSLNRWPQRVHMFWNSDDIDQFVTKTVQNAMQRRRFAKDVLKSFEWSLSEIIGNVFTHSKSPVGALVQALVQPTLQMIRFSVVDAGIGLRKSLGERYPDIKDDASAIQLAIQKGVTRDTNLGQGHGLFGTTKIALSSGGSISIWTGRGLMRSTSQGKTDFLDVPQVAGTSVNFALRTDRALSLKTAIDAVYDPTSIVFLPYEGNEGFSKFKLLDNAKAFPNRVIGKRFRNIVLNLLMQPGNDICGIDFGNVRIVASSFADEFIGMLAVELGPAFERRIRLENLSPDNSRIVATALALRRARGLS